MRKLYRRETQKDKISRKLGLNSAAETIKLQKSEGRRLEPHEANCLIRRLRDMGLKRCCGRKLFKKTSNDLYHEKGR